MHLAAAFAKIHIPIESICLIVFTAAPCPATPHELFFTNRKCFEQKIRVGSSLLR